MYALAKNSKADYWNVGSRDEAIYRLLNESIVRREFAEMFLGDFLGSGISRIVFASRQNKKEVIKIDMSGTLANAQEWAVWCRVSYVKHVAKWFAPVRNISHHGTILIMDRCNLKGQYPTKVPSFFTDVKVANFGYIGKQFVCFDYAYNLLMEQGMKVKMKTVNW